VYACMLYLLIPQIHTISPPNPQSSNIEIAEDGEFLIELSSTVSEETLKQIEQETGGNLKPAFDPADEDYNMDEYYVLDIKDHTQTDKTIKILKNIEGVRWAEKNEILRIETPETLDAKSLFRSGYFNDPGVSKQWSVKILNYAALVRSRPMIKIVIAMVRIAQVLLPPSAITEKALALWFLIMAG